MGSFANFYDMKLVYRKQRNSDVKEQFWEIEFVIDPLEREINYSYFSVDSENKGIVYERKKFRRVNLDFFPEFSTCNEIIQKTKMTSKFARLKNDRFIVYDFEFQNKFLIDEINANIILGTFLIYLIQIFEFEFKFFLLKKGHVLKIKKKSSISKKTASKAFSICKEMKTWKG